jgi:hypothetical protein
MLADFVRVADEVVTRFHPTIVFVDGGQNMGEPRCPNCSTEIAVWWQGAMDRAQAASFADLSVVTPCCGTKTSLNDLDYGWPVGFARFELEAMNPAQDTTPDEQAQLERCLGMRLRKVWQHI